jgi:hypothetical protein
MKTRVCHGMIDADDGPAMIPLIDTVVVEGPNPTHPFGVPGVGDVPVIPPMAAISNAIDCAIGVWRNQPPMLPGRVLEAWWAHGGQTASQHPLPLCALKPTVLDQCNPLNVHMWALSL